MSEQVVIEFIADTSKLEEAYNKLNAQITDSGNLNKDSATAFQKANTDAANSFGLVSDGAKQLNDQLRNLTSILAGGVIKGLINELIAINEAQSKVAGGLRTLTTQLTETKKKIVELAEAGRKGTQEYVNQQKELGRLTGAMAHLQNAISSLNKEVKNLASISIVGKEAAASIQNIGNASQQSAGKIGELESTYLRIETAIKIVKTAMDGYEIATKAVTKAKWLEVEATKAAQAAGTGWVGVTIAGITAIGYAIYDLISKEKEREKEQKLFTQNIKDQNTELSHQKDIYVALGKSVSEIERQQNLLAIKQAEDTKNKIVTGAGVRQLTDDEKQRIKDQNDIIKEKQHENEVITIKGNSDVEKLKEESLERNLKNTKSGLDKELALHQIARATEKRELEMRLTAIDDNEKEKQRREEGNARDWAKVNPDEAQGAASIKNLDDKEKDRALKAATEKNKALQEFDIETSKQGAEIKRKYTLEEDRKTIEARLELAVNGQNKEQELKERIALEDNKNKAVQTDPSSSPADKNKATVEHFVAVSKLTTDFYESEYQKQVAADDRISETKIKSYEAQSAYTEKWSDEQLKLFDDKQKEELAIFIRDKAPMKAEADAFMQQQTLDRDKWLADKALATAQENQQALQQLRTNNATQLQIQKEFHLSQQQVDEMFEKERNANPNATDEQVYASITAKLKPKKDEALAKIKLAADTEKQIAQLSINFAKQAADQIFAVTNQNRNQRFNDEVNMLQKQKDFELNNNNLTQAQKLAIQRKFDKEVAAVKLQQWRADQKSKEEQAIINGALAITNALATAPTILAGIPLAAMAAATTAVQVATIAAQKPPQFAKGTPTGSPNTPAGTKLVGEHGPELIYTPGGERIITAPDTAAILAKYDVPALPNLSPELMLKANAPYAAPLINEKSLARHLATEMAKQNRPIIQFDKNGFTTHLISKGSKTTLVNNKYAL